MRIAWRNVIVFAYLVLAALYGTYLLFTSAKLMTAASGLLIPLRIWVYPSWHAVTAGTIIITCSRGATRRSTCATADST